MPGDEMGGRGQLDSRMAEIAQATGAVLHAYPRPGRAVRRVILRDFSDDRGTRFEAAQIEDDGTLRIVGHDTGRRVSEFFGAPIASYEWVYVVRPERVGALHAGLAGEEGGDVLAALEAYYQRHEGRLHALLTSPEVAAGFDNWHSSRPGGESVHGLVNAVIVLGAFLIGGWFLIRWPFIGRPRRSRYERAPRIRRRAYPRRFRRNRRRWRRGWRRGW